MRRTPNPDDGRSYLMVLTPYGERITQEADPALLIAYLALEKHLLRPLKEVERQLDELNDALAAASGARASAASLSAGNAHTSGGVSTP